MLAVANESFVDWINEHVEERGWSYAELARRSGLSSPTISQVMNGQKNPGFEFCKGIARAFGISRPEFVMMRAGLLPPLPKSTASLREANDLFAQLTDEEQRMLLTQMRALVEQKRGNPKPTVETG